ncbi:hypothetical protein UT300007_14180 [Clostridium sp. CTA-7]
MKKILTVILFSLFLVSCGTQEEKVENVETINYKEIAEEYNSHKEYKKGDIIYYEGEVDKMTWYKDSSYTYTIGLSGIRWYQSSDFSIKKFCDQLQFGGKVKVYGEPLNGRSF